MNHPDLEACSTVIEFPIAWGDMDSFGHVNNARYFTYFESARMRYFEEIGWTEHIDGVGPILAKTDCRFRIPLTYPDTIRLGTQVSELGDDRFLMIYTCVSQRHQKVAAEGSGLCVAFDYTNGAKAPIPTAVRQVMIERDNPAPFQFNSKPKKKNKESG